MNTLALLFLLLFIFVYGVSAFLPAIGRGRNRNGVGAVRNPSRLRLESIDSIFPEINTASKRESETRFGFVDLNGALRSAEELTSKISGGRLREVRPKDGLATILESKKFVSKPVYSRVKKIKYEEVKEAIKKLDMLVKKISLTDEEEVRVRMELDTKCNKFCMIIFSILCIYLVPGLTVSSADWLKIINCKIEYATRLLFKKNRL